MILNEELSMKKRLTKYLGYPILIMIVALMTAKLVQAATTYIDPANRWAWGTNIGWINFNSTHSGVTVYDDHLEGYAWAENAGWIRLGTHQGGGIHSYANDAPGTYGVNNDGAGNLSGYAWGTNIGWINFNPSHSQVTIDPSTGIFSGYAWSENGGWINFNNSGINPYHVAATDTLTVITGGVKTRGNEITDGKVIIGTIKTITIEFNKDVFDPTGSTDPDDVTNPDNYLLVQTGLDVVYDTTDCSGTPAVHPNDIQIPTGPVSYANGGGSGPYISTLTVNNGNQLPVGEYRLFVCGTSSIVDINGVALAGDGVTTQTDLVLTFSIVAQTLPDTGFTPQQETLLEAQPSETAYQDLGDLWIEIPTLELKKAIVGVPLFKDGWDVTWLASNVGYLEGTAFPTWNGNTVITGHVWDAYNQPGPFADLKSLKYGDQINIHSWGQTYTYEVREWKLIRPDNISYATQHEEYDWITLLTCELYNPFNGDYLFRRAVRAVLVDVR